MSAFNNNALIGSSGQGGDYTIARSLRLRSSASAFLNRTPASAGNRKTWTWSGWVKRGILGTTYRSIFQASDGSGNNETIISFEDSNKLLVYSYIGAYQLILQTTQIFRDPSAWYHIVVAVDTTQATASNRAKIYVNGTQITSFSSTTYPSQNYDTYINTTQIHRIGNDLATGSRFFDGYMTEINFIDGQALTPSSFGANSEKTGVWQPKKYAGTYGTNGFYLPFTDNSALTTSSNVGLGKDFSGNGNYWGTSGISITTGSTYDSMTDVPTLTSATAANFATWNPLKSVAAPTNGNLTVSSPQLGGARATQAFTSGKWYWEVTVTNGTIYVEIGVVPVTLDGSTDIGAVSANMSGYYASSGQKILNGSFTSYGASFTSNDVIGVAVDADANTIEFFKNGTSQGSFTMATSAGTEIQPVVGDANNAASVTNTNFGQRPFAYTPPTGFVALNTFNLPTPTIGATATTQANKYFDATLYTGNGSTQSIVNSNSMQPDLVFFKNRSAASSPIIQDSIRGTGKVLVSNSTSGDQNITDYITAFNSNGFSVGNGASGAIVDVNANTNAYVGWQWKANGGTGSTNTAGSITSTVSANTSAGFSVVTYTGNGSANATVGHGLGVTPAMIIVKARNSSTYAWNSWHQKLTDGYYIQFNTTGGQDNSVSIFPSGGVTSTVWNTGGDAIYNNGSGVTYVAYCFSEVAGYSKFGSYTGNGSTTGPFVYTGFRPRFILVKRAVTNSSPDQSNDYSSWVMYDTVRNTYNDQTPNDLYSNKSSAEGVRGNGSATSGLTDMIIGAVSNGFYLSGPATETNANTAVYIYAAFAENPFKYSLAR